MSASYSPKDDVMSVAILEMGLPYPGADHVAISKRACERKRRLGPPTVVTRGYPVTCEIDYTPADLEFMFAIEAWKASTGRRAPAWTEVLVILLSLGYAKAPRKPIEHTKAERV